MKRLINYLFLLVTATCFLCGCNQEDDVEEIFDSGTWYVENYYKEVDWDTNGLNWGKPVYTSKDDRELIGKISIVFDKDGTFTGTLSAKGTYSGKWEAHPGDRSFAIIGPIKTSIHPSGKDSEYIKTLESARFYRGDSKTTLRLAPQSKSNCIQFIHKR